MKGHLWRAITLAVALVGASIPTHVNAQPPAEPGSAPAPATPPPATGGKESPPWKDPAAWIPAAAILVGALVAVWQLQTQRAAARHNAQLARLSKQLSDLYGPLYALYEAGERNWLQFLCEYSSDTRPLNVRLFLPDSGHSFAPPNSDALSEYRRRMKRLFMPTNYAMQRAISGHADLIIGDELPEELTSFLAHVAAATLLMNQWRTDATTSLDVEAHRVRYPHPSGLKNYLRAAFKVLKERQQAMLADPKMNLDERDLVEKMNTQKEVEAETWQVKGPSYSGAMGQRGA